MKIYFEDDFADYILSRGHDYYSKDKVQDVIIEGNEIFATIIGSQPYNVKVTIEDNEFIEGNCTCPYNAKGENCKHMAALLFYLNSKSRSTNSKNNDYSLREIVDSVDDKKLRDFLYDELLNDSTLLNQFRVEFNDYFPKLSKTDYKRKINNSIYNCCGRDGFIDYSRTIEYEHAMLEYIHEAEKLVKPEDYETSFTIVKTILESIPDTPIDDSDGSTGMVADDCIKVIQKILEKTKNPDNSLLKSIFNFVNNEIKTLALDNYGIELYTLIEDFIKSKIYLDKIEKTLIDTLESTKEKDYFYKRQYYIKYLSEIYKHKHIEDKTTELMKEYSFDNNVCMMYVDRLLKLKKTEEAIKVLKDKLESDDFRKSEFALKLSEIYKKNKMDAEYKNLLYDIFYSYKKYDFATYLNIKKLYSKQEWIKQKDEIIKTIKEDKYATQILNDIYNEEKMYDELFLHIKETDLSSIGKYEKYLLPKYKDEILDIYLKYCLSRADNSYGRKDYRDVAHLVNHVIKIDDSKETVKIILKNISETHFRKKPAMKDEFERAIKNIYSYIN